MLEGKKALHIQAAGSEYHRSGKWGIIKFLVHKALGIQSKESCVLQDLGDTYLTNMMKFYGVDDVTRLFIEGADAHRDQRAAILKQALTQAETLAQHF